MPNFKCIFITQHLFYSTIETSWQKKTNFPANLYQTNYQWRSYLQRVYKRPHSSGRVVRFSVVSLACPICAIEPSYAACGGRYPYPDTFPPTHPWSGYAGRVSPPGQRPVSFFFASKATNLGYVVLIFPGERGQHGIMRISIVH